MPDDVHTPLVVHDAPIRPVGHVFAPQSPVGHVTEHEHAVEQSIVPHAFEPLHLTLHASGPHVMSPHAPVPVHVMSHLKPAGQSIGFAPDETSTVHVGVPAPNVHDVHGGDGQVPLPLPAPNTQ